MATGYRMGGGPRRVAPGGRARRGGFAGGGAATAIQAVLSGLAGGMDGLAVQTARDEERRRMEEQTLYARKRDAAAAERQAMADALTLAEQGYIEQGERQRTMDAARPSVGRILNTVAGGMGGATPTDGATGRDWEAAAAAAPAFGRPVSSVSLAGKTYERTETPAQRALREAAVADARARTQRQEIAGEQAAAKSVAAFNAEQAAGAERGRKAGVLRGAFPKLTPDQASAAAEGLADVSDFPAYRPPDRERALTPLQAQEQTEAAREAEAWFNTPTDPATRQQIAATFNNLRAGNPNAPARDLILATYRAMQGMQKSASMGALTSQREAAAEAATARAAAALKNSGLSAPGAGGSTGPMTLQDRMQALQGQGAGAAPTPKAPAAPTGGGTLEQRYPGEMAFIARARQAGKSDAEIDAYLKGKAGR